MNLLELRDRIRTKAIAAGLTYSEIETLFDTNEMSNQTMPCLAWEYNGETNDFESPYTEMTLNVYLIDNFHEADKDETGQYQRDYLITKKNVLRSKYITFLQSLQFEGRTTSDTLEVTNDEQIPIPERLAISSYIYLSTRITIRVKRDYCLNVEIL